MSNFLQLAADTPTDDTGVSAICIWNCSWKYQVPLTKVQFMELEGIIYHDMDKTYLDGYLNDKIS